MEFDTTIRENLDGKFVTISASHISDGVEFVKKNKIEQIMVDGEDGIVFDFKKLKNLSDILKVLSISSNLGVVDNLDSIYELKNIEKIYIDVKQNFNLEASKFPKLKYLGAEYWKGLIDLELLDKIEVIVLTKIPFLDLNLFSKFINLKVLHIYSSKIENTKGLEKLQNLEEISLARNTNLIDISTIFELKSLKSLIISKCKKLDNNLIIKKMESKPDVILKIIK